MNESRNLFLPLDKSFWYFKLNSISVLFNLIHVLLFFSSLSIKWSLITRESVRNLHRGWAKFWHVSSIKNNPKKNNKNLISNLRPCFQTNNRKLTLNTKNLNMVTDENISGYVHRCAYICICAYTGVCTLESVSFNFYLYISFIKSENYVPFLVYSL